MISESKDAEDIIKSPAEFSLYMMKFSNKEEIKNSVNLIERKMA